MKNKNISKKELIEEVTKLGSKLNRTPMKRDDCSLNYYARRIFGSWNNLMKAAGYDVRFYQKINHIKLDNNLAYFLGLLITDGNIYFNEELKKYKVAIYTSFPEEKRMIIRLINQLFNYKPGLSSRMYGFSKRPNYEIRISSKNLAKMITSQFGIPSGSKSFLITVPEEIKKSSMMIKMAFLRGVIDGDGSIFNKTVKISSGSAKFIKEVKELLKELGISSGTIVKDNETTFSTRIERYNQVVKIKKIYSLGYSYPRKKKRIDKI